MTMLKFIKRNKVNIALVCGVLALWTLLVFAEPQAAETIEPESISEYALRGIHTAYDTDTEWQELLYDIGIRNAQASQELQEILSITEDMWNKVGILYTRYARHRDVPFQHLQEATRILESQLLRARTRPDPPDSRDWNSIRQAEHHLDVTLTTHLGMPTFSEWRASQAQQGIPNEKLIALYEMQSGFNHWNLALTAMNIGLMVIVIFALVWGRR
jgi:hypothetical protein